MKIRVSNLDPSSTEEDLLALFSEIGEVDYVEFDEEPDPGGLTFSAVVSMPYENEAEEAISELNGEWFDGNQIRVKTSTQQDHQPRSDEDDHEPLVDEELEDGPYYEPIKRKKPREGGRDSKRPPKSRGGR